MESPLRRRLAVAICLLVGSAGPTATPLTCFGNELSSVAFGMLDRARALQAGSIAFEGVPWRLTSLPGHAPGALAALEPGITARFEAGRVTGFGGCNVFTGS